jgi:DNA replication licensing factor MCM7
MALLTFKAPVDYETHQGIEIPIAIQLNTNNQPGAFEEFLQNFKSSPTSALTSALDGMNIDEDDFSDEYDFMDDDDEEGQSARRKTKTQAKEPSHKYKDLLQKVADRYEDEITIDLDDLAKVRSAFYMP